MTPASSYRIFISYARADATDIALRLRNDLSAAGHDVWLDLAEIAAGSSWARDIEEAIEGCHIAITLLSNGSYVSDICRGEQLRALRKGKRVIPVLVQSDADRPLHLEHLNYLDFSDVGHYQRMLTDLLIYINTGQMPPPQSVPTKQATDSTMPLPPIKPAHPATESKRDARAYRRYLGDLREEPWLGDRHWWTYFLFYFADVTDVVKILSEHEILPPLRHKRRHDRWDRMVRLYFRPRTPDLFGCEGIRPAEQQPNTHCPVPVYLLFDLEAVLTTPGVRFSEGDVTITKKTFTAASAFRDMPFDLIYHDSWIPRQEQDRGERGEILSARRAQVFIPERLELEHVTHILCRSEAEKETLLALMPGEARRHWEAKINTRPDYNLFNGRWLYVDKATLTPQGALFQFSLCDGANTEACQRYNLRAEIQTSDGEQHIIDLGEIAPEAELALDLTELDIKTDYSLYLYLSGALAYVGEHHITADAR